METKRALPLMLGDNTIISDIMCSKCGKSGENHNGNDTKATVPVSALSEFGAKYFFNTYRPCFHRRPKQLKVFFSFLFNH